MGQSNSVRCETCAVRHRAVCGALSTSEIQHLNAIAHHRHLEPGDVILRDGEQTDYFANIVSGVVKLTKGLPDGREQIVGLEFPSDFIGRPYRGSSPYAAEAVTPVQLCTFDRLRFERVARDIPGFERRLFSHTLDELDAAREWMTLLGRKTAEERVASFLLMVSSRMDSVGCEAGNEETREPSFSLPLTRAEIGDFLGLTIETVSRQFTRFKAAGVINLDQRRTVVLTDVNRLREIAFGDEAGL